MMWYGIFNKKTLYGVEEGEDLANEIARRMKKDDEAMRIFSTDYQVRPVIITEVEIVHETVTERVAARVDRKPDPGRFLDI